MTITINRRAFVYTVVYGFMGLLASAMVGALSAAVFGAQAFFAGMIVGICVLTVPGWFFIFDRGIHYQKNPGGHAGNILDAVCILPSAMALAALVFSGIGPIFDAAYGAGSAGGLILRLLVGFCALVAGAAIGIWIANGIRVMLRAMNAAIDRMTTP
ncbi:hypothetical protein [Minwuia thermotolerans]|uniref:hypothetical protein n=1 Tax=Minwuia thermotolerans TaxID=2056226 RepID=UPI000F63751C|nr:hypothetical protein [Minwuia thermotolerans]